MQVCKDCGYRGEFEESMTVYRPEMICPNCESGRIDEISDMEYLISEAEYKEDR